MRKLTMLAVLLGALLWCQAAFAQYSALEDHPGSDVSVGLGGIALSGGGDTVDGSEFVPTISLTGITDMVVWQAFYGFGDASVFGGSLDYILASNFDECAECPEDNLWWFGGGLSLISYTDLFADGTAVAGIDDTEVGVNLGGGTRWDDWGLDVYLHYFPSNEILGVQGQLLYNFN
jgi:hypothetical protein